MSLRGYDAWLTTPPEEPDILVPGEEGYPRCGRCGAFLKREPDPALTTYGEQTEHCDGQLVIVATECGRLSGHDPHVFTAQGWSELHRACTRCGHDNTEIEN